jgi:hypothetical protein
MLKFNFITDDSHGWLEVKLDEEPCASLFADGSGYINGNTIYLEEDGEAPKFLEHLKNEGIEYSITEKNYNGQWYGRAYARNVSGIHYNNTNENEG